MGYNLLIILKHYSTLGLLHLSMWLPCLGKRRISTASSVNSLLTLKKASCKHWKSMWPDKAQSFYQAQMGCDEVTGRLKVCVRKEHV